MFEINTIKMYQKSLNCLDKKCFAINLRIGDRSMRLEKNIALL